MAESLHWSMFARNPVSPPFSRVFVAKSRRRRQSYGAFLAPGA